MYPNYNITRPKIIKFAYTLPGVQKVHRVYTFLSRKKYSLSGNEKKKELNKLIIFILMRILST